MPTLKENWHKWDQTYHWVDSGDNWSAPWGNAFMQWHASILPRIRRLVPAPVILEIAPGFGRWTTYLKDLCETLIVVDISERCIQACRQRFQASSHITYHVNDGLQLDMVPDGSIDFVFSFDSLVHAEADVIESYLRALGRSLKPNGVGLIHHSNAGEYSKYLRFVRSFAPLRPLLRFVGFETKTHGRALNVSAETFKQMADAAGLVCISQELINWQSPLLVDCMSVITPRNSCWARPTQTLRNPNFMREAALIKNFAGLYSEQ